MSDSLEFRTFAERLVDGEDQAARELLARYSTKLIRLASDRLNPRLRSKLDSEDVLQSVMRSFFRRVQTGGVELRNWQSLWGLLTLMTLRKCARQAIRFAAAHRDVQLERRVAHSDDSARFAWAIPSPDPGPEEAAMLADYVDHLLSILDEADRDVIERVLAGQSTTEIAAARKCSERTVQRTIFRVRRQWLRQARETQWD